MLRGVWAFFFGRADMSRDSLRYVAAWAVLPSKSEINSDV